MNSNTLKLASFAALAVGLALPAPAQNTTVTYQGRITDSGTNFTGTGQFKFALVTSTNTDHQATATANLTGQFVTSVAVVNGGNGYVSPPGVTFSGGGGSGAAATAMISGGVVTNIAVNNAGSGYTSAPTVTVAPPPPNFSYLTYWSNDGTSVNGSEPASAISLSVVNGLFTAVLGDVTVANMIPLDAALFAQPDLQLRIWFNDGVSGSVALDPVQNLTAAPYAAFAQTSGTVSGVLSNTALAGTYSGALTFSNPSNSFAGIFSGDGSGVTNVNAVTLGGLGANQLWQLNGNSGTTAGTQFLGTADNQPLELKVNGLRSFRLEPDPLGYGSPNVIGGSPVNFVDPGIDGATICGGGSVSYLPPSSNRVSAIFGTIVGGRNNTVAADHSFIGGGYINLVQALAYDSVIGGGEGNTIHSNNLGSVIVGGYYNNISGPGGVIGGGYNNAIHTNASYSVIGGGSANSAGAINGIIGGGQGNLIQTNGSYSFIGGGYHNTVTAPSGTLGGGESNTAGGAGDATVGGGFGNTADGQNATVGGGLDNHAGGFGATVPGGYFNLASGDYSFAAGQEAQALHLGTFVWADESQFGAFSSTGPNQFLIRATGGVGIGTASPATQLHVASPNQTVAIIDGSNPGGTWLGLGNSTTGGQRWSIISSGSANGEGPGRLIFFTSQSNSRKMMLDGSGNLTINGTLSQGSDRNVKTGFEPVNVEGILEKVATLPLMKWAYTNDAAVKHLGPMAQDFYAAFQVGLDDQHITTVDESGVALAAIQGLNQKLESKDAQLATLEKRVAELEQLVRRLAAK